MMAPYASGISSEEASAIMRVIADTMRLSGRLVWMILLPFSNPTLSQKRFWAGGRSYVGPPLHHNSRRDSFGRLDVEGAAVQAVGAYGRACRLRRR